MSDEMPDSGGLSSTERPDGRAFDEMRPLKITRNVNKWAEGSALSEQGDTKVSCYGYS